MDAVNDTESRSARLTPNFEWVEIFAVISSLWPEFLRTDTSDDSQLPKLRTRVRFPSPAPDTVARSRLDFVATTDKVVANIDVGFRHCSPLLTVATLSQLPSRTVHHAWRT